MAPSIRDDLVGVVDEARAEIESLGLRVRGVAVVHVTKETAPDQLVPTKLEQVVALSPRPRVRQSSAWVGGEAGKMQSGDLVVDRISATYTREQLDPPGDGHWLIDDEPYRVVSCEERFSQWVVRLRRLARMPEEA